MQACLATQPTPSAVAGLNNIKGFITLLPIHWTEGENSKMPYHNALLTKIEPQGTSKTTIARNTSSDGLPDPKEASPS